MLPSHPPGRRLRASLDVAPKGRQTRGTSVDRTILVGDIHGCREEFERLLNECGFCDGEPLVLVGDLVAKGPDSAGVVELARRSGARAVLGNHDARVLRLRDVREGKLPPEARPTKPEHQRVLESLTPEDFAYLDGLPHLLRLGPEEPGKADTIVVHAGVVPGIPLESQDPDQLMNLRSIQDDGTPTKKLKGRPWAQVWQGPELIVFGHDALRGLQLQRFATGLDTGCVYGKSLTALILPERRLVSVPAKHEYLRIQG